MAFAKRNKAKSLQRSDSIHSRYVQMLLDIDDVPFLHNALAAFFVWLLLAGFLFFPGTFTSIRKSVENKHSDNIGDQATEMIVKSVKNIPLLVIAAVACVSSLVGMSCLAAKHAQNYVWVQNKLVIPGVANSLAGLISTLVGVYSQQKGVWSPTARITVIVEASCLGLMAALFLGVEKGLRRVRAQHGTHYNGWPKP